MFDFALGRSQLSRSMRSRIASMSGWAGMPVSAKAAAVVGAVASVGASEQLDLHDVLQLAEAGLGGRATMAERRAVASAMFPGLLSERGGTRTLGAAVMPLAAAVSRVRSAVAKPVAVPPPPPAAPQSKVPVSRAAARQAQAALEWNQDLNACQANYGSRREYIAARVDELEDQDFKAAHAPKPVAAPVPVASAPVALAAAIPPAAVVLACGPVPSPNWPEADRVAYAQREWDADVAGVKSRFGSASSFIALRKRELGGMAGCATGCPTWTPPPSVVVPTKEAAEAQARGEWAADTGGCRGRFVLSGEAGYVALRARELRGGYSRNDRGDSHCQEVR